MFTYYYVNSPEKSKDESAEAEYKMLRLQLTNTAYDVVGRANLREQNKHLLE